MMLLAAAIAFATEGPESVQAVPLTEDRPTFKQVMLPLRVETRVSFRDNTQPGVVQELGAQLVRRGNLTVDAVVNFHSIHGLGVPGFRSYMAFDAGVDGMVEAGNWLAIGPTLRLSTRLFRQQWIVVRTVPTPVLGARAHVGFLRARKWSLGFSALVGTDLVRTELVLDTAAIVELAPIEAQFGIRAQFGYGHARDLRKGAR